jgi:hypothetical protein
MFGWQWHMRMLVPTVLLLHTFSKKSLKTKYIREQAIISCTTNVYVVLVKVDYFFQHI